MPATASWDAMWRSRSSRVAFARDADRLARFEREAQTLATLNHPHIAQIYGFEQSGDDVGARHGARRRATTSPNGCGAARFPMDEALAIARQIAAALEAAHEIGIVHRDLKPANIKVTPRGTVKVLDFGLAKAVDASASGTSDTAAITVAGTHRRPESFSAPPHT